MMDLSLTKQSKIILLSILSLALLGGVSYGGWRCWQDRQVTPEPQEQPIEEQKPEEKPTPITKPTSDPNWNLYINEKHGFSVEYPAGWEVEEKALSTDSDPEYLIRDQMNFIKQGSAYVNVYIEDSQTKDLAEWSRENESSIISGGAKLPSGTDSRIAGFPAIVVFSPEGQAPTKITALFKQDIHIFRIDHFVPAGAGPLLWSVCDHFLRAFEFEGTESIPDKLPKFPMGF